MVSTLEQHKSFLKLLIESEPMQRTAMVRTATPAQIRAIIECIKHALKLTPLNVQHDHVIQTLVSDTAPYGKKAKLIAQHGGNLAYMLAPLISGLYNLLY